MPFATITSVAGAEKVTCQAGQSMDCAFTVTSESRGPIRISLQVLAEAATKKEWLKVVGAHERDLPASGNEPVTVRISVPADAEPGKYPFRLRAYDPDDPEQSAESPAVAAEVPTPVVKPPVTQTPEKHFPWWIVAVAAVVLVIGGGVTWYLLSGPKVPALKDMRLDAAVDQLEKAGLQAGDVTEQVTGSADAGVVLDQSPEPGAEAEKGSKVDLTIEAVSVEVPELVGMPITEASDALVAAGLETGEIAKEKRTGQKGGTVLQQTPAAGERVLPGTPVALTVVDEVIVVASLVGQTSAEAGKTLSGQGLRVGRITERRTGGSPGVVLSQTPAANVRVAPGTKVNLVVEEKKIVVPSLVRKSSRTAVSILQREGLRARVSSRFTGHQTAGTVISQSPAARARVSPGTTVSLVVERTKILAPLKIEATQMKLMKEFASPTGTLRIVPPAEK
jgi:beta-lactam-binding protein with PASTA domain